MDTIDEICCACGAHGPVAMLATTGRNARLAICRTCADDRAAVRAFAARFDRERDCAARLRGADRSRADVAAVSGAAAR